MLTCKVKTLPSPTRVFKNTKLSENVHEPLEAPGISSTVLEGKNLNEPFDTVEYKKFCAALQQPSDKRFGSKKQRWFKKIELPNEKMISGHLFKEKPDLLNKSIEVSSFRKTVIARIVDLLNGSYKKLIKQSTRTVAGNRAHVRNNYNQHNNKMSTNFAV